MSNYFVGIQFVSVHRAGILDYFNHIVAKSG